MLSYSHNLTTVDLLLIAIVTAFVIYLYHKVLTLQRLLPYTVSHKKSKILSVVAGENLDMTEIEKALYSTDITYNLLPYASVTQDSVLAELNKGYTVFDLSSHGLNGKFALGNTVLPISWLSHALIDCKALEAVLLLYCKSAQDISEIASLGLFVVGLTDEVKDTDCITFSRNFYFYLNKKYDYTEAFERAKLHLHMDVYPKFIFKDGRNSSQWHTKIYQKNIKDLLTVMFTV